MPLDYGTLTVLNWSRMVFNEADYGFGEARYVFTLNDDVNIVASAICLRPLVFKHGIQLMLHYVEEPHADASSPRSALSQHESILLPRRIYVDIKIPNFDVNNLPSQIVVVQVS